MNSPTSIHSSTLFVLLLLVVALLSSCAADEAGSADYASPGGEPQWNYDAAPGDTVDLLAAAEQALLNHNVVRAREFYQEALAVNPSEGRGAAGLAATKLLLLPGFSEVASLLIEDLGARHGLDANDVLYGRDGYLYWRSRGTSWDDQGQFEGIRSILANRLPWSREKLTSLAIFADGLIRPVDGMMDNLITVARALETIEATFEIALEDPSFTRLYIPGQVFHDERLAIVLGRSEIAAVQSALALARGLIFFIAAYEHDWTLEEAFGTWRDDVNVNDTRYVEGFLPDDYTATYLDEKLFRAVAHPQRLIESRAALKRGLLKARLVLDLGLEESLTTTFQWQLIEAQHALDLITLVEAFTAALDAPNPIPFTSPSTSLDLSSFFDEGRVLSAQTPWLVTGEDDAWILNDDALEAFFIVDVFSPAASAQDLPTFDVPLDLPRTLVDDYLDRLRMAFP